MRTILMSAAACALLAAPALVAQQEMHPTCNKCAGVYITAGEIDTYAKRAIANNIIDQQVRAVDVGKSHVDVGIVYRGKLAAPAPNSVAEHDHVSEVYHVIEGSGVLMLGPDIVGAQPRPATDRAVALLNGPGSNGTSIQNGVSYTLKPGDVVIVPAGTGHWFQKIDDHLLYLMVRVDPEKLTPLKDEAASKVDLAGKPQ